jgi:hypothetical protein
VKYEVFLGEEIPAKHHQSGHHLGAEIMPVRVFGQAPHHHTIAQQPYAANQHKDG